MTTREHILELKKRIAADIIGQGEVVDQLLIAILSNEHVLMEGLPGLAKTAAYDMNKAIALDEWEASRHVALVRRWLLYHPGERP